MKAKNKRRIIVIIAQVISIIIFLVIWQYLVMSGVILPQFLAPPSAILTQGPNVLKDPFNYERIVYTIEMSILTYTVVLVLGTLIGLLLGLIMSLRKALEPYILMLYAVPKSIFLPIFVFAFGFGFLYEFWYIVYAAILPLIINIMYGVRDIDPLLIRMAKSFGIKPYQIYYKIILPSIIPSILSGARISLRSVLTEVIIAEQFVGTNGAGYLTILYATFFRPVELYTVVITLALIGIGLQYLISRIEKIVLKWTVVISE